MKDYLNFIDISSWQAGFDIEKVFSLNSDLDGVIVKSSGGASYVQKTCDPWVQKLISMGKPWGFYHYLNDDGLGSSGKEEAEFFVKTCENYFGDGMPFADYEGTALKFGTDYLLEFLDTVYSLTGCRAGLYTSLSVVQEQDFDTIAAEGYPLWLAQYGSSSLRKTFKNIPWQQGSYAPFTKYIMHQWSPAGMLEGYSGNLDLDRFYGTVSDWEELLSGVKEADWDTPVLDDIDTDGKNAELMDQIDNLMAELLEKIREMRDSLT